jgi:protein-tyrosine phosphatase
MTPLHPAQQDRLTRFGIEESIDVHCHCLPGLDDGPANLQDAVALCRALVADGVTTVVATPHQLGPYERGNDGAKIRRCAADLDATLVALAVPLRVVPGAEVRVDERVPELLRTGEVLTLGDAGGHLLLELPHHHYIDAVPVIRALAGRGVRSIIAHPERLRLVSTRPSLVQSWVEAGAVLQVTAASLAGRFGATAEKVAWDLVAAGMVALVASDAHGVRHRSPRLTEVIDLLSKRHGEALARRVCLENPRRVLLRPGARAAACPASPGVFGRAKGFGPVAAALETSSEVSR